MKIDYSDFLDHLIDNFVRNDNKLQSHLESSNYEFDLIDFIKYMLDYEVDSYNFYLSSIKHYYRLYDCKDISGDDIDTFLKLIDEFSESNLLKIIFLNDSLVNSLKNYLRCNPIKTLISIPYFKRALTESISPYIQDYNGIVFFENKDTSPNLYINPFDNSKYNTQNSNSQNNDTINLLDNASIIPNRDTTNNQDAEAQSIIINQLYLENILSVFAEKVLLPNQYSPLIVNIKNNIINFSYSNIQLKAMLVNKKDFNSILKSFSCCAEKEHSIILRSFLNEEIPYEFVVLYLNDSNKFIDIATKEPKEWVIKQFEAIKKNSYFKRIAKEYSIPFAVFVHSIYPCGDINEFLTDESKFKTASYDEYSIFSFLTWIYKKKYNL